MSEEIRKQNKPQEEDRVTLAFIQNFGMGEIGIVILILVLLFGARRIPQLARALGSSLAEFKKGRQEGERKGGESKPRMDANGREGEKETPRGEA